MTKRPNKEMMYSFNGTYCSEEDMTALSIYFEELIHGFAQSNVSEIIDLNNHKKKRDTIKIRSIFKFKQDKPFVFINCLN
jgi:hypothetical protein